MRTSAQPPTSEPGSGQLNTAEEFFNEIFMRWFVDGWTLIHAFRRVAKIGLQAKGAIVDDSVRTIKEFFGDPEHADIYIGDPAKRAESLSKLVETMAAGVIQNAAAGTDAASVIFAHSVLDGAALDCCRVSALAALTDWEPEVTDRQIKIGTVKGSSYEELLRQAVEKYFDHLERETLLLKLDRLFAKCQPPTGWSPMRGYAFDRGRLAAFDDLRHDITHRRGPRIIPGLDTELDYLNKTTMFFLGLLNQRYGLRLDPTYPMRRPQEEAPES